MKVIKRDGTPQEYSFIKIADAIRKAFNSILIVSDTNIDQEEYLIRLNELKLKQQPEISKFLEQVKESVEKVIIKNNGNGTPIEEIQDTIAKIDPLPGAREFLDSLRELTQVIIISDTFTQFAKPLMKKLGWPTLFCNTLEVADDGEITGFKMRCEQSKLTTVKALQSVGFETIASGDSHNDLGMILASKAGFLFRSTDAIKAEYPDLPAYESYDELLEAIKNVL